MANISTFLLVLFVGSIPFIDSVTSAQILKRQIELEVHTGPVNEPSATRIDKKPDEFGYVEVDVNDPRYKKMAELSIKDLAKVSNQTLELVKFLSAEVKTEEKQLHFVMTVVVKGLRDGLSSCFFILSQENSTDIDKPVNIIDHRCIPFA